MNTRSPWSWPVYYNLVEGKQERMVSIPVPINKASEANQIIAELLKENHIRYNISSGGLYVEFETPIGRAHLYLTNNDGSPFVEAKCVRPDPANPNFTEDVKEFIRCCSSNSTCIRCRRYKLRLR